MRFVFTLFILLVSFVRATSIEIVNNKSVYDDFTLSYFNSPTFTFPIDKVAQQSFDKTTSSSFTLGYKEYDVWFKLDVVNRSHMQEFILSLNESFYEKMNLYYKENGVWHQEALSLFTPMDKRKIKSNKLSLPLHIPHNAKRTYYLQIQGKLAYFGDIVIYQRDAFYYDKELDSNTVYIYILGAISIVVILNFFLFLKFKEIVYFYYSGYGFFNFIYLLNMSGLLGYINLQQYMYILHASSGFLLGFMVLFSKEYLEVHTHLKLMEKPLQFISMLFFGLGFLLLFDYTPWNKIINNFAALANIALIVSAIIIYFKGFHKTKYYIFAIVLFFSFVIVFTTMVVGILPYTNITRYGFVIASGIEVALFSLLLASRYNDIKVQHEMNLEDQINKRTLALKEANSKLQDFVVERELLLKEVYHRVKNNFHMILGMLWLVGDKKEIQAQPLQELTNRIKSMSIIHEHLYDYKDLTRIPIKEYIKKIIFNITSSYKVSIDVHIKIDNIVIIFDHAVSLGIVINEIITNAIKHNRIDKNFSIELSIIQHEKKLELLIKDNGKGFDEQTAQKGLGLRLVKQFCQKLPDSMQEYRFENGTVFILRFSIL